MVGFPRTSTLSAWLLEVGGTAGEHCGPAGETDVAVTVQLLPPAGVDRTARLVGVGPGGGDGASGGAREVDGKLSGGVTSASCCPFGLEADTASDRPPAVRVSLVTHLLHLAEEETTVTLRTVG